MLKNILLETMENIKSINFVCIVWILLHGYSVSALASPQVPDRVMISGEAKADLVGFHQFKDDESLSDFVKRIGGFEVREYVSKKGVRERLSIVLLRMDNNGAPLAYIFDIESDGIAASKFILKPQDSIEVVRFRSLVYEKWEDYKSIPKKTVKIFFCNKKRGGVARKLREGSAKK